MEKFKKSLITDAGRKMLLGLGAGSSQLTYTKAVLYDQDLSSMEDDQIRALTTMSGEKLSTEIKQVKVKDNTVIAYAVFQNADLVDDVVFRAVGWYAKSSVDNIEHLLAVSPSIGTQTLASGSPDHRSTAEIDINLAMAISDAVSVNVLVDQTGVVHNKDLQDAIEQVKIDLKTDIEQAGKVETISVDGGEKIQPVDKNINLNLGLDIFVNKSELTDSNSRLTKDIQGKLDQKADKTEVYTKSNIDDMHSKTYFRKQGIDQNGNAVEIRANAVKQSNGGYAIDIYDTDWTAAKLRDALPQIAALNAAKDGVQKEAPDFNTLTDSGNYYVTNTSDATNAPSSSWGNLVVWHGSGARIEQVYFPDSGDAPFFRMDSGGNWLAWKQLVTKDNLDITNGKVANHENRITKLEQNEFTIRHYTKAQEAEGMAWVNEDPLHRLAIITDE